MSRLNYVDLKRHWATGWKAPQAAQHASRGSALATGWHCLAFWQVGSYSKRCDSSKKNPIALACNIRSVRPPNGSFEQQLLHAHVVPLQAAETEFAPGTIAQLVQTGFSTDTSQRAKRGSTATTRQAVARGLERTTKATRKSTGTRLSGVMWMSEPIDCLSIDAVVSFKQRLGCSGKARIAVPPSVAAHLRSPRQNNARPSKAS